MIRAGSSSLLEKEQAGRKRPACFVSGPRQFGSGAKPIGIGMWLALIMAFNVWFIIWPNQKKALGIVVVEAAEKAAAAKMAGMTSRFNPMLSIPMLYCMAAQSHGGF